MNEKELEAIMEEALHKSIMEKLNAEGITIEDGEVVPIKKASTTFEEKMDNIINKLDNKKAEIQANSNMHPSVAMGAEIAGTFMAIGIVVIFFMLIYLGIKKTYRKIKE